MLELEFFGSVRSPYTWLVTPRLFALQRDHEVSIRVRPVYPHAVRDRALMATRGPLWMSYFRTDIVRLAEFLDLPIAWPRPDPVASDPASGEALSLDQQHDLRRVTHLAQAAAETGRGMDYWHALSRALWTPGGPEWTQPGVLEAVAEQAGLDADGLGRRVEAEGNVLEARVQANDAAAKAAGHWGVPLMVFQGEPFFGQDRFDVLIWRLRQAGLRARG